MKLFRRPPVPCAVTHCGRDASLRLSNGPDIALVCARHVLRYEHRWGQVFIRGIR